MIWPSLRSGEAAIKRIDTARASEPATRTLVTARARQKKAVGMIEILIYLKESCRNARMLQVPSRQSARGKPP
jgi:hypothetical protein